MKTWEYMIVSATGIGVKTELAMMDDLGGDGWELATTVKQDANIVHYFKRPTEDRWYVEREDVTADQIELALTGDNGEGDKDVIVDAITQQAAAQAR